MLIVSQIILFSLEDAASSKRNHFTFLEVSHFFPSQLILNELRHQRNSDFVDATTNCAHRQWF